MHVTVLRFRRTSAFFQRLDKLEEEIALARMAYLWA